MFQEWFSKVTEVEGPDIVPMNPPVGDKENLLASKITGSLSGTFHDPGGFKKTPDWCGALNWTPRPSVIQR